MRGVQHAMMAAGATPPPYDATPSIVAAFGMRRLLTSYSGPLLRLRRASDNAEADFGATGGGDLDTAAISAWLGAAAGYARTWYDQSDGGRHAAQATAASQPLYVASAQNGRPAIRDNGGGQHLSFGSVAMSSFTVILAQNTRGIINPGQYVVGGTGQGVANGGTSPSFPGWGAFDGTRLLTATVEPLGWALLVAQNSKLFRNGSEAAYSQTNTLTGLTLSALFTRPDFTPIAANCDLGEVVICNAVLAAPDRQVAEAAANLYWNLY